MAILGLILGARLFAVFAFVLIWLYGRHEAIFPFR
jgi:hypothetical protein